MLATLAALGIDVASLRKPIGHRSNGAPIYPIAGGDPSLAATDVSVSRTLDEWRALETEMKSRMKEIDSEATGRSMNDAERDEFGSIKELLQEVGRISHELQLRKDFIGGLDDSAHSESGDSTTTRGSGPTIIKRRTDAEVSDVATIRAQSRSRDEYRASMHDNALRAVERARLPQVPGNADAAARAALVKLLDRELDDDEEVSFKDSSVARQILQTNDPAYQRAFRNYVTGSAQTTHEQNALASVKRALSTGSTGFPVVWQLDPTLVPTSNFAVNPWRALARIQPIAGTNEWRAVTSGGITASYAAEAAESTDNSPTLAQPDIFAERAQAYVPFSIEASQDWPEIQSALGGDLADAKDVLEATKFALGAGHGSNEPKGIITAATATTTAGGVGTFAIADIYKLFEALPPRFRPRAQFVANLFTIDKIRQFDTSGGSGVWLGPQGLQPSADSVNAGTIGASVGVPLLGRNVWESTAMASVLTTGSKIVLVGDFRYFVIVERIGMNVEIDPMVLGTNRRPTGQRALYAYWRNSSDALSASAFQVLVTG